MKLFAHLTIANLKMIVRNRQALFWALAFPLVFVLLFALIGSFGGSTTAIGIVDYADDALSRRMAGELAAVDGFEVETRGDEARARRDVESGELNYLLIMPSGLAERARTNPPASIQMLSQEGRDADAAAMAVARFVAETNVELADASERLSLSVETAPSQSLGFAEFTLPGIALWGIMSNSVIGMAVALSNYRERKILRRIKASPLRAQTFFAAQVAAYLVVALAQAALILGIGSLAMGVRIPPGSLIVVAAIVPLSAVAFLNLGFVVGAFSKTAAAASGLGNLVVMPLLVLSGALFPLDALPASLAAVLRLLPLTPMVEILRGVTLRSQRIEEFGLELAIILAWIAITSVAAARLFKFE